MSFIHSSDRWKKDHGTIIWRKEQSSFIRTLRKSESTGLGAQPSPSQESTSTVQPSEETLNHRREGKRNRAMGQRTKKNHGRLKIICICLHLLQDRTPGQSLTAPFPEGRQLSSSFNPQDLFSPRRFKSSCLRPLYSYCQHLLKCKN